MKKLINKPHIFFFLLAVVAFIIALIFDTDQIIIDYYGADFVIQLKHIYYLSVVFFCLIGFNYFSIHWTSKKPIMSLTVIHILLQTISFILLVTHNQWGSDFIVIIAFLLFLLATLFHLINFFVSLFSRAK